VLVQIVLISYHFNVIVHFIIWWYLGYFFGSCSIIVWFVMKMLTQL